MKLKQFDHSSNIFTASDIDSKPVELETSDSFKQNISFYKDNDYTFVPIIDETKYYNTKQDYKSEISHDQIINDSVSLKEVIRRLKDHPFLIVEHSRFKGHIVKDGEHLGKVINDKIVKKDSESLENLESKLGEIIDLKDVNITYKAESLSKSGTMELKTEGALDEDKYKEIKEGYQVIEKNFDVDIDEISQKYLISNFEAYGRGFNYFENDPPEIFGIITHSDLNKRPVREMVYPNIAQIAAEISDKIEEEYPDSRDLIDQLGEFTVGSWYKNKRDDMQIHISEFMSLSELKTVIENSNNEFIRECGFESKTKVRDDLGSLEHIRNRVMHANRTLVRERNDIEDIYRRINLTEEILEKVQD